MFKIFLEGRRLAVEESKIDCLMEAFDFQGNQKEQILVKGNLNE